ncbi:glycosyltransferase [Bifidobacterium pullorum]|nr:glycosyltransferase [Bifidobacterium pullorum]
MLELYKKSDFGMVASMSNISLVPYEMLATGLPVIEFKSGSFESFFPSEAGILIDYNYQTLANRLLSIHNDASQLTKMLEQANAILGKSNWFRSALQFEKILKKIVA